MYYNVQVETEIHLNYNNENIKIILNNNTHYLIEADHAKHAELRALKIAEKICRENNVKTDLSLYVVKGVTQIYEIGNTLEDGKVLFLEARSNEETKYI